MAHKPFKPIDISKSEKPKIAAKTVKVDHSTKPAIACGEQDTLSCTIPYTGVRRSVNVTVNASELQAGIRKQKQAFAQTIREHEEYKRVPKGERKLKRNLPLEEEYLTDGDVKVTRPSTETTRRER